MGGKILNYPAKDILNQGRAEGIIKTARKYHASDEEILEQLMQELSIEECKAKEYLATFMQVQRAVLSFR